jgi:hypothetical protein
MAERRASPRRNRSTRPRTGLRAPSQKPLYVADDHGRPVKLDPSVFVSARDRRWGALAESFERLNRAGLAALDVQLQYRSELDGPTIHLVPGSRAGAVPLRSAQTGHVVGGFIVRPRFGWAGVGRVLSQTGWQALPDFLDQPLVPGSGREVPPWVLAGPVIARLSALLSALRRGYQEREAILRRPRGRILWDRYRSEALARGHWDRLPCRFPELEADPQVRREVRWAVERIHRDLVLVGGTDPIAVGLAAVAARLLEQLADVQPLKPRREALQRRLGNSRLLAEALQRGLEALGWIVDERGLGGGRESDGLAWALPLDRLWEQYVERQVREQARLTGGQVLVGRLGETTFPLHWSHAAHRSLGHLEPDFVVRRGRSVRVIDAKYKAHLAELDEVGWRQFAEQTREAHRADLHQVLAYAALYDAEDLTAALVYPLRHQTWEALRSNGRDISRCELHAGGRQLRLELQGLPFGSLHP